MTRAYKCNKCGDFHEGQPHRRVILGKPGTPQEEPMADLCEPCFDTLRTELNVTETHFDS